MERQVLVCCTQCQNTHTQAYLGTDKVNWTARPTFIIRIIRICRNPRKFGDLTMPEKLCFIQRSFLKVQGSATWALCRHPRPGTRARLVRRRTQHGVQKTRPVLIGRQTTVPPQCHYSAGTVPHSAGAWLDITASSLSVSSFLNPQNCLSHTPCPIARNALMPAVLAELAGSVVEPQMRKSHACMLERLSR